MRADERRERHHGAVVVPDVIIADVLYALAVFPFGLEVDAPLPAEAVELVQVQTTQIGLQRLVDVRDGHALLQHFVAIHIGIDLRDGGGELCRDSRQLRTPAACGEELLQILVEKVDRPAAAILEPEREPPRVAESRNGWRHESKGHGLRHLGRQRPVQTINNGARCTLLRSALVPGSETDEEEALVTG